MKKLLLLLAVLTLVGCGSIEEGNVGVRTTFTGKVVNEEMPQGFYTKLTSSVDQYSAKEITVELNDMRPKAGDNLSLADLDLEVYYRTEANLIADLKIKYSKRTGWKDGVGLPAYFLVRSMAREATYNEIAKYNSLEIHKNRDKLADAISASLQTSLDKSDPQTFVVTKVIVRSAVTDPSIEESIKLKVARQNELKAKETELEIAEKQVAINQKLDQSLTPAVLRQRELDVQMAAIEKGVVAQMILGNATPVFNVNQ